MVVAQHAGANNFGQLVQAWVGHALRRRWARCQERKFLRQMLLVMPLNKVDLPDVGKADDAQLNPNGVPLILLKMCLGTDF